MGKRLFFILFSLLNCVILFADHDPVKQLENRVVSHTLKNGMKVLILERHIAPLVSFQMMFRAGGVDEVPGKTGLAHLFEHMMFKGSKIVGTKNYEKEKVIHKEIDRIARQIIDEESKENNADAGKINSLRKKMNELEEEQQKWIDTSEFDGIYQREGGEGLNAFTAQDMTGFVVSLPSNKWELWPVMESDRMANPVLREFYKEKDVVMEERRMRYENAPQGKIWENFVSKAYTAHPYQSPTIGWMKDIKKLTLADAEHFYQEHYAPNNATVAIVGDVVPEEVIQKLEKYFSKISSQPMISVSVPEEPPQTEERRTMVPFDSEPMMLMGFHKPNPPHPDNFAIEVIEDILSRGRTGRFNRNIVDKKIAVSVWASNGNPGERYPNLIVIGASPRNPFKNSDVEKAIWKEIEHLGKEKVPEKELQKIRNQIEADFIRNLSSNMGMASEMAYDQTVIGDWRYLFRYLDGIRKVTPEDIHRTANEYFKKSNCTVAYLQREGSGKK